MDNNRGSKEETRSEGVTLRQGERVELPILIGITWKPSCIDVGSK